MLAQTMGLADDLGRVSGGGGSTSSPGRSPVIVLQPVGSTGGGCVACPEQANGFVQSDYQGFKAGWVPELCPKPATHVHAWNGCVPDSEFTITSVKARDGVYLGSRVMTCVGGGTCALNNPKSLSSSVTEGMDKINSEYGPGEAKIISEAAKLSSEMNASVTIPKGTQMSLDGVPQGAEVAVSPVYRAFEVVVQQKDVKTGKVLRDIPVVIMSPSGTLGKGGA